MEVGIHNILITENVAIVSWMYPVTRDIQSSYSKKVYYYQIR
jgi:hypothetical protein